MSSNPATATGAPPPRAGSRSASFLRPQLGNFGWPILLRQLRADFRKSRFFLSQFICLCILGVTLIALISHDSAEQSKSAVQVGLGLFNSFFIIQYLIILVIFPAFSSTAFSEERAGLTMDLLLVTSLKPTEIVWGKFLASMIYCLVYVIASIPLLSISFLFGGVELPEVLIAYAILIGMTLFVSMVGVCVSSCCASSIRATIATYMIIFVLLGASWYLYSQIGTESNVGAQRSLLGSLSLWGGPGLSLTVLHLAVVPAIGFVYLFLLTANRIRPAADDKSSPLRLLTLFSVLGFIAAGLWRRIAWAGGRLLPAANTSDWFKDLTIETAVLLVVAAIVFPTEEANVSRRNRLRFARLRGLFYPLRVFSPGAFWGAVYAIALSFLVSAGLLGVWKLCFAGLAADSLDHLITEFLLTLPFYASALASIGFLLAACDFTPVYSRLTVGFVLVITMLLPVICMLSKDRDAVWSGWDVLWRGYYLSPITLWASLDPASDDTSQFLLFGVPIVTAARVILGAFACAFFAGGVYLSRKAGYPILRFNPRQPPPARRLR